MSFLGCKFRFVCENYSSCNQICSSLLEGDFLKCEEFRLRENKESVLNGKRK